MEKIINHLLDIVWHPALIYLCLGAGLFYSIKTRFAQIRHFWEMIRLLFERRESQEGISSFQALTVALSGRVGIGNIVGVAAAIGFGGPGAVFWMWIMAILGASTAYVESTLAQIYKVKDKDQFRGGPAYYFESFFNSRLLGAIFAVSAIISCGFFLPGVQANGIAGAIEMIAKSDEMINTSFGPVAKNQLITLAIILIILGMIIFGGIKRIAQVTEIVVPFMALGYIIIALLVVFINIKDLPGVISLIISDAFTAKAGLGAAIFWGVKRGIYSNEAGQGTGPHHAAAADVAHPAQQGLVQAFSVYIDTLFVCSATAFMILITKQYNVQGALEAGNFLVQNIAADVEINSSQFTQMAVSTVFGKFGVTFTGIAVFFFAFTTILAYYYIAETNAAYLFRKNKQLAIFLVKFAVMFSVAYGVLNKPGYIWDIGDIGVGLTSWINIVGILLIYFISGPAVLCLKDYEAQKKLGRKITFDPIKLGIKNAKFWEERNK